jgi:hypothetical protein
VLVEPDAHRPSKAGSTMAVDSGVEGDAALVDAGDATTSC